MPPMRNEDSHAQARFGRPIHLLVPGLSKIAIASAVVGFNFIAGN
jgi:hypothetical protein